MKPCALLKSVKLTQQAVIVPAEFPGTNLMSISKLPNKNVLFDTEPEPTTKAVRDVNDIVYMSVSYIYSQSPSWTVD